MKAPIVIFYHIFCYHNWQEIVVEQLNRLKQSGVYDACSVMFVRLIGSEPDLSEYRKIAKDFRKIHLIGEIENNDH